MSCRKASVSLSTSVDQGLLGHGPPCCLGPPIEEVEDEAEDELELRLKQNVIELRI